MTEPSRDALLPSAFGPPSALRRPNAIATAAALAAVTGSISTGGFLMGQRPWFARGAYFGSADVGSVTALTTFLTALVWMSFIRDAIRDRRATAGTLLSIALAAANASVACTVTSWSLYGAIAGLSFGALLWAPALVATWLAFGLPMLWANREARKGLGGGDRGEQAVAGAALFWSTTSILVMCFEQLRGAYGGAVPHALAGIAVVLGVHVVVSARRRTALRRELLASVRDDAAATDYRVDVRDHVRVLLRVDARGEIYRGAVMETPVFTLDDDGDVLAPIAPTTSR